jgi:hypothetical protein
MAPRIFEENRLIDLLKEFDAGLTLDYLHKLRELNRLLKESGIMVNVEPIKDKGLVDPIAVRFSLQRTCFLMLSHPICRMHTKIHYPIEFSWERFYITKLGMLPAYLFGLNIITVLKFWAEAAQQSSSQALNLLGHREAFFRLQPSTRAMQYSSMNFVIPFGANLFLLPKEMDDLLRKYFLYSLWLGPKPGFTFSTHMLHTKSHVRYLLKLTKSLCLLDKLGEQRNLHILGRTIPARKVSIRILVEQNGKFFFIPVKALIPNDVVQQLQEESDLEKVFLNAIVLEVREKFNRFELLSVLCDVGASFYELSQSVMGYVLSSRYYRNEHVVYVCSADQLKRDFENMLGQIWRHIKLDYTISDLIKNAYDIALDLLYPLFVIHDDQIYYLHPMLVEYIFSMGALDVILERENRQKLMALLRFMEKTKKFQRHMDLFLDDDLEIIKEAFQTSNKKQLIFDAYESVRQINISKVLRLSF